jgi:DNA-binding transcriptional ArsR family regulator
MNDGMIVRIWQDVLMEQPLAEAEPQAIRTVDSVDALKAMADPTRQAILAALMKTRHDLPVMSVKELAAELGEPQTKLYRHVRQLEAAGLIRVASTRMVSGILEQRYQACQQDLRLGGGFLREHVEESIGVMQAALDRFRDGFLAVFGEDRESAGDDVRAAEIYRKPMLSLSDVKISSAKAAELRAKLEEIVNDLNDDKTEDPAGIQVSLLIGCYVPGGSDPGTR